MFSNAPVAFLCTRMSLDLARRVSGCRAPERAILALLSSCVARFVMHPTALHCTSTLGEFICLMRGARPPSATMEMVSGDVLFTARLPKAALAARWTSRSGFWSKKRMGSSVSRSTSRTSASDCGQAWEKQLGAGPGTSLCDLSKSQACRPLQINVV